jgi:hypothetical protein
MARGVLFFTLAKSATAQVTLADIRQYMLKSVCIYVGIIFSIFLVSGV